LSYHWSPGFTTGTGILTGDDINPPERISRIVSRIVFKAGGSDFKNGTVFSNFGSAKEYP